MKIRKILALLLALVLCAGVFTACTGGEQQEKETVTYSVKVVDGQGTPYTTGVIVKFMQGQTQAGMQLVNENGVAEKSLPKGDYTLEIVFMDESLNGYFDPEQAVLSADKTSVEIALVNSTGGNTTELFATSPVTGEGRSYEASYVAEGSTHITVEPTERTYFIFAPAASGTYRIAVENKELKLGYYGSPFFVQENSVETVTDNAFSISISESMIGSGATGSVSLVLGVDGVDTKQESVLVITRTGDAQKSISDEPWTPYVTSHQPAPFTLELGDKELTYVDITGKTEDNQVVFNEADGFYHFGTADGPVVYMHLGKKAPYVALQTVIMSDGPMGGAPIRRYFYDEAGNFLKKEDYTNILTEYFSNMDPQLGIYPLTADLVYIIQNGCSGWWTASSPDYIFEGCNPEIGWMYALCYIA